MFPDICQVNPHLQDDVISLFNLANKPQNTQNWFCPPSIFSSSEFNDVFFSLVFVLVEFFDRDGVTFMFDVTSPHLRFICRCCQATTRVSWSCKRLVFSQSCTQPRGWGANGTSGSGLTDRCLPPPDAPSSHLPASFCVTLLKLRRRILDFCELFSLFARNNDALACIAHQRQPGKRLWRSLHVVRCLNYVSGFQ